MQKNLFDSMFGLQSYKITDLWPNDSLTFTFCKTFSNNKPIFNKNPFGFDAKHSLFMPHSQIGYQSKQFLKNNFFWFNV